MKKKLHKAGYVFGIVFVLSLILLANLGRTTEVQAACSKVPCGSCDANGKRYSAYCTTCYTYRYRTSGGGGTCSGCGKSLNFANYAACSNCGGDKLLTGDHKWGVTKTITNATCTTQGEWRYYCSYCDQKGETPHYTDALGHAWPADYTYTNSNGLTNGARYMDCTRCAGRLSTQYACWVYASDGISAVAGTNWYEHGSNVTISATPSEGYAWDHWEWTGGGYGTDNPFTFSIAQAYQFYAYGHALDVTITYDANGGTQAPEDQVLHYGENNYITDAKPVRVGYTFQHWTANLEADGLSSAYIIQPGDLYPAARRGGTRTLVAQWTQNDYTMTLDPNGGTCPTESVNPRYDEDWYYCMSSHTPERKGYRFLGWYDAVEGGTQVFKADGYCTNEGTYYENNIWKYPDDVTLHAHWEAIPYTVTYDANGGTTANREFIKYYDEEIDLSLTAENPGYIFVGWNTNPVATAGLSNIKMQEEDITLYAIYSIAVSDIANHSYDENGQHNYTPVKEREVFLRIWELGKETVYKEYFLSYEYDIATMAYRYMMDESVTDFVKSGKSYGYAVYAYDNAGNWAVIDSGAISDTTPPPIEEIPDPEPQKYQQTVKHYRYDCIVGDYIHFASTVEEVEENESYKPLFLTPPTGYETERMEYPAGCAVAADGSYTVTKTATTKAYYKPLEYTLTFDANGGTTNVAKKNIRYGDYYGEMPTPVRKGYSFVGWFTEKNGGEQITSSDKYLLDSDSTLFAHWSINSYTVTYDYWTNGGTNVSVAQKNFNYGAQVDLSVTAGKVEDGYGNWTFVGWNTDAGATTGLNSITMSDSDITLYAIYKKDITVTLIQQKGTDTTTTQKTLFKTVYNNETDAEFEISNAYYWSDWTLTGWTTATGAEEAPMYGNHTVYAFRNNVTLYALYMKEITLAYDTNGSATSIEEQTKEAYHNAAGNSKYPTFVTASGPELGNHSFVNWKVESGAVQDNLGNPITVCGPRVLITVSDNTLLTAAWDAHPKIEAYNRHFTLEQARSGFITQAELLKKVKATDEEKKSASNPEGLLTNGQDVIVVGYTASTFTSLTGDAELHVVYEATDDFGNIVTQTVTVSVTNTELIESPKKSYVRFISRQFLLDDSGNLVPESKGGLAETSTWRTNSSYRNLLINTLFNSKTPVETWIFTREDIAEIKKKL